MRRAPEVGPDQAVTPVQNSAQVGPDQAVMVGPAQVDIANGSEEAHGMDAVAGHVWSSGSDSGPAGDHPAWTQRTTLTPAAEPPPRRRASAIVAVVLLASAMVGAGCRSD